MHSEEYLPYQNAFLLIFEGLLNMVVDLHLPL